MCFLVTFPSHRGRRSWFGGMFVVSRVPAFVSPLVSRSSEAMSRLRSLIFGRKMLVSSQGVRYFRQVSRSSSHQSFVPSAEPCRRGSSYYRARGWVAHANSDRWLGTAVHGDAAWALCPTCGAWTALHLWEAYEFTRCLRGCCGDDGVQLAVAGAPRLGRASSIMARSIGTGGALASSRGYP